MNIEHDKTGVVFILLGLAQIKLNSEEYRWFNSIREFCSILQNSNM